MLPDAIVAVKRPIRIKARKMPVAFEVETLEGTIRGAAGDWLLEGVRGEMYPCRADIFEETYEVFNDPY